MGMYLTVKGVRLPDAEWKKMKSVYDVCKLADIEPPDEVVSFFDGEEPDADGVVVNLTSHKSVTEYTTEYTSGFDILIEDLPEAIKIIRCVLE